LLYENTGARSQESGDRIIILLFFFCILTSVFSYKNIVTSEPIAKVPLPSLDGRGEGLFERFAIGSIDRNFTNSIINGERYDPDKKYYSL